MPTSKKYENTLKIKVACDFHISNLYKQNHLKAFNMADEINVNNEVNYQFIYLYFWPDKIIYQELPTHIWVASTTSWIDCSWVNCQCKYVDEQLVEVFFGRVKDDTLQK